MESTVITYFGNYIPVGDILVLATCIVFALLIRTAYISRTRSFQLFVYILITLVVASISNMLCYIFLNHLDTVPSFIPVALKIIYHFSLYGNMFLYVVYTKEPMQLSDKESKIHRMISLCVYAGLIIAEILGSVLHYGFYVDEENGIHKGLNLFPIGYLVFFTLLFIIMIWHRNNVFQKVLIGVILTCIVSLLLMVSQAFNHQSSFTTASFLFPAFALLYLIHSNPYDIELGTVNADAFEDYVAYHHRKNNELIFMSLFMHDYEQKGKKYPEGMQKTIRIFASRYFRSATIFLVSGGHMILSTPIAKNPDYQDMVQKMLDHFLQEYPVYRIEYKIIVCTSVEEVSRENNYLALFSYIQNRMSQNTIRRLETKDIESYHEHQYILRELRDIYRKKDLNDPRIEVYCQPVFNVQTEKYDTAEALMRLRLDKTGLVFPDRFIPIAERHNCIHVLSLIILSKTCRAVRDILSDGYYVKRVSVNFSMLDVREDDFSSTIINIIKTSGIPCEKIAIELTESQNERDFMIVKEKVTELKKSGIKFYLDDFGTGYSNFDRILELPFDIVKFDRSLVLASRSDIRSETMVSYLAHMFSDMNYSVLYEGVENDDDEDRCGRMCAKYLQGYKYSKPIPIERLREFFEKENVSR